MTTHTPSRRSLLGALLAAVCAGLFGKKNPIVTPADVSATCDVAALPRDANSTTLTVSARGLPAGLRLDSTTGVISGVINNSGQIDIV